MIHGFIDPIVEHLYQYLPDDRKDVINRFRQVLPSKPNPVKDLIIPNGERSANLVFIADLAESAIKNHLILDELIRRNASPDSIATASFLAAAFFCQIEKEQDTHIFEEILRDAIMPTFNHGVTMLSAPKLPRSNPLRDVLTEIVSEIYEKTGTFPTCREVIAKLSHLSEIDHPIIREVDDIENVVSWNQKNGRIKYTEPSAIQARLTTIRKQIKKNQSF